MKPARDILDSLSMPRPDYDYVLFVGPGRSATTYIYRILRTYYDVAFPNIKESYYYRDSRRYGRARKSVSDSELLGDVANEAYLDPALQDSVGRMTSEGARVLLVVTLREHVARANSMVRYATSRGKSLWRGGREGLERHIVRKSLTPGHLEKIYSTDADVIVLDFDILTAQPTELLNRLAEQCGISPHAACLPRVRFNASEASRSVLLSAAATGLSKTLRGAGFRSTLQRLKDSQRIHGLLFKSLTDGRTPATELSLKPEHEELLRRLHLQCWESVRKNSDLKAEGFYFRDASR